MRTVVARGIRLGSRQLRVLEHVVWCVDEYGDDDGWPVGFSAHWNYTLSDGLDWRTESGEARWIEAREAYRIAERLRDLGFVEIDLDAWMVRPTKAGRDYLAANPITKE